MNTTHTTETSDAIVRIVITVVGWLTSWKLGEIQALLGIISAIVVTGYAGTQWYVLWRDKIRRRNTLEESSDA